MPGQPEQNSLPLVLRLLLEVVWSHGSYNKKKKIFTRLFSHSACPIISIHEKPFLMFPCEEVVHTYTRFSLRYAEPVNNLHKILYILTVGSLPVCEGCAHRKSKQHTKVDLYKVSVVRAVLKCYEHVTRLPHTVHATHNIFNSVSHRQRGYGILHQTKPAPICFCLFCYKTHGVIHKNTQRHNKSTTWYQKLIHKTSVVWL